MASKAALRSRRMRMDSSPESAAIRRSSVILRRAVSVLWWGRKPDWNCSYRLLFDRWAWICDATTFYRILERNGRLEMGRRLLKMLGSKPGFLSIGVYLKICSFSALLMHECFSSEWALTHELCFPVFFSHLFKFPLMESSRDAADRPDFINGRNIIISAESHRSPSGWVVDIKTISQERVELRVDLLGLSSEWAVLQHRVRGRTQIRTRVRESTLKFILVLESSERTQG